eukprot:NODE_1294_length_1599_cov_10.358065_g1159_i0.p1 GENE.NODE_1294_length_1599_cov_10.358065_g1159_i0~~NODE_1294_length_1599_cov_10.358065_g1159_i0.p1  ORF type:complete len:298 (+),score=41.52 NODE_1294_length_1599_cov_10.358065_g1159_i0:479-1372(+)
MNKHRSVPGIKVWLAVCHNKELIAQMRQYLLGVAEGHTLFTRFCPHKYVLKTLEQQSRMHADASMLSWQTGRPAEDFIYKGRRHHWKEQRRAANATPWAGDHCYPLYGADMVQLQAEFWDSSASDSQYCMGSSPLPHSSASGYTGSADQWQLGQDDGTHLLSATGESPSPVFAHWWGPTSSTSSPLVGPSPGEAFPVALNYGQTASSISSSSSSSSSSSASSSSSREAAAAPSSSESKLRASSSDHLSTAPSTCSDASIGSPLARIAEKLGALGLETATPVAQMARLLVERNRRVRA